MVKKRGRWEAWIFWTARMWPRLYANRHGFQLFTGLGFVVGVTSPEFWR